MATLTFPNTKKTAESVKFGLEEHIYVVVCQYRNGKWGTASFFGMPFTANTYSRVVELKQAIVRIRCDDVWKKKDFMVAKIAF